jgi:chlorite dismutase
MQQEKPSLDLREKGKNTAGEVIYLDRRLYMQLLAYGGCQNVGSLIEALGEAGLEGVLYLDLNDPQGIALLTFSESPDHFLLTVRQFLNQPPFSQLTAKPEYTMFGRTYALGHEDDLERAILVRPRQKVLNPAQPWAIWYPLRRAGHFETLSEQEKRVVLMEHGGIGFTFGRAGYASDIRLACHGLDKHDNDFVIGLLGGELHPISAVVEAMRKTKQTSMYLASLGPFFVGKAIWQSQV